MYVYFQYFEDYLIDFEGWFIKCKYISIILKNVSLSEDCLNLKANSSNASLFP
jgi:hypothetical protein